MHQTQAEILSGPKSYYLAPLDALRFFAFLAVFLHHLPAPTSSAVMTMIRDYGWAGVDLFFVISSFLFFYLLDAEHQKAGSISARNFYIRRLMRIYPLMVGFPVLMLLIYGAPDWPKALARLAGLAMFSDNFVAWIDGYNKAIRYSAHLWTLSFEFQVYLFIPAAFLAWKAMGSRAFLILLGSILLLAIALRTTFSLVGAKHPVIWVTPFLRPDSVILGLALVVVRPRWHWGYSAAAGAMGLALFLSIGVPWSGPLPGAASYLVLAVTAAAIVDAALRSPIKDVTKKTGPIVRLGRISFGLYVYHLVAIWATARWIAWIWRPLTPKESVADYLILLTATLAVTIAFSAASYLLVERRFEKAKLRFTVVSGRPVGAAA